MRNQEEYPTFRFHYLASIRDAENVDETIDNSPLFPVSVVGISGECALIKAIDMLLYLPGYNLEDDHYWHMEIMKIEEVV